LFFSLKYYSILSTHVFFSIEADTCGHGDGLHFGRGGRDRGEAAGRAISRQQLPAPLQPFQMKSPPKKKKICFIGWSKFQNKQRSANKS